MILSSIVLLFVSITVSRAANTFYYEIHGSLLGVPETDRTIAAVETKFHSDIRSTHNRNDLSLDVHELKSDYGIHKESAIFYGYLTTSISNRAELISLLKSVPTIAVAYVAPKVSLPERNVQSLISALQCGADGIPLPNNTCSCPAFTSGSSCQTVTCQNFGLYDGNRCICPPGYYSKYCENRAYRPAIEKDLDISKRSLVIVFSLSSSMQQDFASFRASLANMVKGMEGSGTAISTFVFWGFVLTDSNILTYYTTHGTQLSDLDSIFDVITFSDAAPNQPFLSTIIQAQQFYPDTRAFTNVLVFLDSGASDAGARNDLFSARTPEQLLIMHVNTWHNQLTFIVTQNPKKPISTSDNSFDVYRRLAVATQGDLLVIDKSDVSDVMERVLNTYHKMENLAVRYKFSCNDMKLDLTVVDDFTKKLVLLTVDKNNGNPARFDGPYITDMNRNQLQIASYGQYYAFYEISNAAERITVISPTAGLTCSLRVFTNSNNALLLSYMNNRQIDIGTPIMYQDIPQIASGLPLGYSGFDSVEIQPLDPGSGNQLASSVRGFKRAGVATYAYEFDDLANCTAGPFVQQVQLRSGNDVITHVLPGYCALPGPPLMQSEMLKSPVTAVKDLSNNGCTQMNLNAIVDPKQHEYRQIVFAIENGAAMNTAALNLIRIINSTISQIRQATTERQFSLILFDDNEVELLTSTHDSNAFVDDFTAAMKRVLDNDRLLPQSRSLEAIFKVPQISLLSPTILYLFTATSPSPFNYTRSLPRDLQVNLFMINDGGQISASGDLTYHQRASGGRSMPISNNGVLMMSPLLASAVTENALIYDGAVQDCSTSAPFIFNVEEEATSLVLTIVGQDVNSATMVFLSDPSNNPVAIPGYISFVDQNTMTVSINLNQIQYRATPWSLSVRTSSGPCFVQVRAKSPLTVIPGFTSIVSNDYPAESPFSARGSDHHAFTVLRLPNISYTVDQISIGPGDVANPWTDMTSLQSVQALLRDTASCSYQYISAKNVEMPTSNLVRMEVSGHTSTSAWYNRTFYFEQINDFASVCNHGQANMYGECVCADGYSGQFCDLPPCRNGGTRSMTVCLCATGYYGQLCENRVRGFETTSTTTSTTTGVPLQPITRGFETTTTTTSTTTGVPLQPITTGFEITSTTTSTTTGVPLQPTTRGFETTSTTTSTTTGVPLQPTTRGFETTTTTTTTKTTRIPLQPITRVSAALNVFLIFFVVLFKLL